MPKDLVTIFILNWNRGEDTLRAIKSAERQTYSNVEILVVDNGSQDNSVELIKNNYPTVRIIQLEKNYGCPGGRNRGIKYCNGRYIFFLDNDGVLHEKAVENAVKSINNDEDVKIVTGKVYSFKNEAEIDTTFPVDHLSCNRETRSFQGGISLHDKTIYSEIGYYPDDFFYGGEEGHLSVRAFDYGYKIVQNRGVVLWHVKSEHARDKESEQIRANINRFTTIYQLYPAILVLFFALKYFTYYFFLASKSNNGLNFINRSIEELPKRLMRSKRNPLSFSGIKKYYQRPPYEVHQKE